jgi:GDPmannose 4,6-dehydratase
MDESRRVYTLNLHGWDSTLKALITGIAGQDGSYLSELLLSKGFDVYGLIRRNSTPEHQESRINHLEDQIQLFYGDLTDFYSVATAIHKLQPDVIFNLAAQSHVRISFDIPSFTHEVNAKGAYNVFEATRLLSPSSRIYQASSSEMFGTSIDSDGFQRESTNMRPASPYGVAKLAAYHLGRTYRDSYGMFISNGILFNHESPRRGSNFVTTKVIKGALEIKRGTETSLALGNLDSSRDWGHSRDYVEAMLAIMMHDKPEDFVVATGQSHSIKELCDIVFQTLSLDWRDFVTFDQRLLRPKEVPALRGDSSYIRQTLGWQPKTTFTQLIHEMMVFWANQMGVSL